ncbi:MAG: DUF192 domain-containing protein [Bacteroidales bacterium]|nr:DUF192 domain-containing protein [Bacteroidales bacterium]
MKQKLSVYNLTIAVILVLILVIGSLLIFVNPTPKRPHKSDAVMNEQPVIASKPVFRKDGELRFLDGKTNKVITQINIEVADNDAERAQGLMYRDTMDENAGMLFLMEAEEPQAFWMENTIISLDILYADAGKRIVSIQKNCKPYSTDQIPSIKPALYVVEVNAGYTSKYNIKVGDVISF